MRPIIYHVAVTLDGFIAKKDGSTPGFSETGEHVTDYLNALKDYDDTIMGRKTYEYGYQYGLKPGQPAYPHMTHHIFSKTLNFEDQHEQVKVIGEDQLTYIQHLKETTGSPIYLCGGGELAGFLLNHKLIDEVILKQNPMIYGTGIPLFGNTCANLDLKEVCRVSYDNGVSLLHHQVNYINEEVAV